MSITWENTPTPQTQAFSADQAIDNKVKLAVAGLQPSIQKLFLEFASERDKELVADFMLSETKQENAAVNTKRVHLVGLAYLSRYLGNKISFEKMTASDLSNYLESMQKNTIEDPDQSWISTQKTYGRALQKFFKWLAYPDLTPQERNYLPREKLPPVLSKVVLQTKKGSKSPIKAKDIWNDQDTAIFLKHCKDNPRLRFYHALAIETSGRPGELLQLKIGDINIESDSEGELYAALDIGRYGKRKQSRIVGITDFSIQYFQRYLPYHPDPTNKGAYIFASKEHSAYSRNMHISGDMLRIDYTSFRDKTIPKLLKERPDIPDADKKHLQMLKDQKKWNPYTMRHSSITKLARHPNVNDYVLRQHAGWSKRSDMVEIYTHELKGDSLEHVMLAYGINIKNKRGDKSAQQLREELVGPHCPFCKMVNVPGTQFCISCNRPVSTVSYENVVREAENTKKELEAIKQQQKERDEKLNEMEILVKQNVEQARKRYEDAKDTVKERKKLLEQYNHHIAELKLTIRQTKELKGFLASHLNPKHREEFNTLLVNINNNERKRLEEEEEEQEKKESFR